MLLRSRNLPSTVRDFDARTRLSGRVRERRAKTIHSRSSPSPFADAIPVAGQTTTYLIDTQNPTGYAKAIEEYRGAATPTRSYVLGLDILAQVDPSETPVYLLKDGRGATRLLLDADGALIPDQIFEFTAFYDRVEQSPIAARTEWLPPDGRTDAETGFTYSLARHRDSWRFLSYDSFEADPSSPADLHKYLYANANPIMGIDPSGHMTMAELQVRITAGSLLFTLGAGAAIFGVGVRNIARGIQDKGIIPDAIVFSIGGAYAARGFSGGATVQFIATLRQPRGIYFSITPEFGTAPVSGFKKHRGFGTLASVGAVYNMEKISDLHGLGCTATFPFVGTRFMGILARAFTGGKVLDGPINFLAQLAQYSIGKNIVNSREGVMQMSLSSSGPAMFSIGRRTYSLGTTGGYTLGPWPIAQLSGALATNASQLEGLFASVDASSPEALGGAVGRALALLGTSSDANIDEA